MPLRDHYHPPVFLQVNPEGLHGFWPGHMIRQLNRHMPPEFRAEPTVHSGKVVEVDVATFEFDATNPWNSDWSSNSGGTVLAEWKVSAPSLDLEVEYLEPAEYEVRIYDAERQRTLVAAIELVSPSNKDRPEHRRAFTEKCAALIIQGVAVTIVDIVTSRTANLYAAVMDRIGHPDEVFVPSAEGLYTASIRSLKRPNRYAVQTWTYPMSVGQPLPTPPIWLTPELAIPLELEASYTEACMDLRIA
jgi:hypothetical protein